MDNTSNISLDSRRTCALTKENDLYCWGAGHIGTGDGYGRYVPQKILSNIKLVRVQGSTCAITESNDLYCWGSCMTCGGDENWDRPLPYKMLEKIQDFYLWMHSCAKTIQNELYCWGQNEKGQAGIGYTTHFTNRISPTKILGNVRDFKLGHEHTCAVNTLNNLYCWGNNEFGQVGAGSETKQPIPQHILENIKDIDLGYYHTCALTNSDELYCWGGK